MTSLCRETLGCLVLDSGCSNNVCGEDWLTSYVQALSEEDRKLVKILPNVLKKKFRFGGDEVLPSRRVVRFPAVLAGRKVNITTQVVASTIPLLWSRPSMKKAGVVLDLEGDRAKILGSWVSLDLTAAGHYALHILPAAGSDEVLLEDAALLTMSEESEALKSTLKKIHRQFGHPSIEVEETLLKKANKWNKNIKTMLETIHEKCKTCKLFTKVPPRPVVALPPASEFNKVVTMDLKEVKRGEFKYILHMIDGYTRLSVSVFLKNKQTATIAREFMKNWVAVGYGCPARCWTDGGGEFNSSVMKELGEAIGCKMETGAGYSGWMYGINERNHAVIDQCFEKIMADHQAMDPEIALAWAVNAKNSFPMYGGYSSYTLVFGKNPTMPGVMQDKLPALCGVTTSESVATHIQALYSSRRAFTTALCDDRIRSALRHKVRAVERQFQQGEEVFFQREGDSHRWRGPATVLGNKGTVHYLVHQGEVIRVSSCRMVGTGEADEQLNKQEAVTVTEQRPSKQEKQPVAGQVLGLGHITLPGEHQAATGGELGPGLAILSKQVQPEAGGEQEMQPGLAGEEQGQDDPILHEEGTHQGKGLKPMGTEKRSRSKSVQRNYPKAGEKLQIMEEEQWQDLEVLGRGGKASSKLNSDYFNVKNKEDDTEKGVHLDKQTWRFDNVREGENIEGEDAEYEDAMVVLIPAAEHSNKDCVAAKEKELKAWHEFTAMKEVDDQGQQTISYRWVLVEKMIKGSIRVKARLCARGFEESIQVQTDSPTGNKENLRLLIALAASQGWEIKTVDFSNAYLQGEKLKREVYMEPPPEAKKPGKIWRLLKSVYGMNDAGRQWFFRVRSAMLDMGWQQGRLDNCLFFLHREGQLVGIVILWVDDFFFSCSETCEKELIKNLESTFKVGNKEVNEFTYTGINFKKTQDGIEVNQHKYVQSLQTALLSRKSPKINPPNKEETTLLKRLTGKVNWAATQTRPDLAFAVVELSVKYKAPTLEDLLAANKAITRLISNPLTLIYPKLAGELSLVTYSDAAFRNLPDQVSSGRGHIIFLQGERSGNRAAPIAWASNKVKRVVGSTIAAEALSLICAMDHGYYLRAILEQLLGQEKGQMKIVSYVDSRNLFNAVFSTSMVEDKKLRCDIAQIKENVEKENVNLKWVPGKKMQTA